MGKVKVIRIKRGIYCGDAVVLSETDTHWVVRPALGHLRRDGTQYVTFKGSDRKRLIRKGLPSIVQVFEADLIE